MPSDPGRPVLVVLHQEQSTPGRLGEHLEALGLALDVRKPRFGDRLPPTLAGHRGAIVFGGPMSANDNEDYLRAETDWLAVPLREEAPLLGLCLGAQLLARHLGAPVWAHPDGNVEIGWFPLHATAAGRELVAWPRVVHQFHREGFDLPSGAILLARGGEAFPNQAFSYGPAAFAIQFHIELTNAMVERWTSRIGERAHLPGGQAAELHLEGRRLHDRATVGFMEAFVAAWLATDRRQAGA